MADQGTHEKIDDGLTHPRTIDGTTLTPQPHVVRDWGSHGGHNYYCRY